MLKTFVESSPEKTTQKKKKTVKAYSNTSAESRKSSALSNLGLNPSLMTPFCSADNGGCSVLQRGIFSIDSMEVVFYSVSTSFHDHQLLVLDVSISSQC